MGGINGAEQRKSGQWDGEILEEEEVVVEDPQWWDVKPSLGF